MERGASTGVYTLEIKAKFTEDSLKHDAEQLLRDIDQTILDVYHSESQEEQIIRENRHTATTFHRLYLNLVDKNNTLAKKVDELKKKYSLHGALFSLTPQER
jgi:hypothetical protein